MTRKPPKNINSDDIVLFREAAAGARPVKNRRATNLSPPPPSARAVFRRRDEKRVLEESLNPSPGMADIETGEELRFRRSGVSPGIFNKLRGGHYAVKSELDLHGMTSLQARSALREFLTECLNERLQCVRIVHGKGLRSGPRGPVLKVSVDRWLRQFDAVLAFSSAPARDGGTGAVYVLLKR